MAIGRVRRSAAVACAVVGLSLAVTGPVAADPRGTSFEPGSGQAIGAVAHVGGIGAHLRFVAAYGQSVATYRGSEGQSRSQTVDLGVAGVLLTTPICPGTPAPIDKGSLPPEAAARTGEPGAADGRSVFLSETPTAPVGGTAGEEQAWATADPGSGAATTLVAFGTPAAIAIEGGRSDARTGVVGHRVREAVATSKVAVVDVLGGKLRMEGLRWDAVQRTDAAGRVIETTGRFSVDRVWVGGQPVAVDPTAPSSFDVVNRLLAPTGLTLVAPTVDVRDGEVSIGPLGVHLLDSPISHEVVAPLLGALQPVRTPVGTAARQQSCSLALGLEAADVGLSALAGTGGGVLDIGGASATTEGERYSTPFGSVEPGVRTAPAVEAVRGLQTAPTTRTGSVESANRVVVGAGSSVVRHVRGRSAAAASRSLSGAAGGTAAVAAVVAVALIGGVAGADARRIALEEDA